ncbi:MAG: peptidoglycan DD-metalloendopeptidase family protein [Candidatus Levybacteria bacterium]|nr:peptidoglycan DD-metalloendopeptidase family protein [Candidatus Levybacteria bacterium]MBI3093051.1 peptidoglycan DD-metalloendopeptidase family protein [Candidatus Levybacteria bacterium]
MSLLTKKWIALFFLVTSLVFLNNNFTSAQEPTPTPTPTIAPDTSSDTLLKDLQNRINELEKKVADLQSQERTLSSQIAIMDSQIKLTQLRINATKQEIEEITADIEITTEKILSLEESLDKITKVLINRIVATYRVGSIQPLQILLSSNTVSDFFTRANYLRIAQANDKKLIFATQQAKNDYSNQKEIFEDKKDKVEALKKQLEAYTARLDQEKKSKEVLLEITRNDEERYQELLQRLRADADSIRRAISNVGVSIGLKKRGEKIANVGSSGCSTGPHLHLEVFENARVANGRVEGNRVDPKPFLDDGRFFKVVDFYDGKYWKEGGSITTLFNEFYNIFGAATAHTGLDIAGPYGSPIYAAADGEAYLASASCPYQIQGGTSVGRGIIMDHKNGYVTLYWHIP